MFSLYVWILIVKMDLTPLVNGIGFIDAICTTISFLPQVLKITKTKETAGISLYMYMIFTAGVFMWLIYGILKKDIPVTLANAVTLVFAGIIISFKLKYG